MRRSSRTVSRSLVLLLALRTALFEASTFADQKTDIEAIRAAAREGNRVMDHLDILCNRIGPRLTGSDNLQTACEWARKQFARFGLENARLEPWGEIPVGFNRGPWSGKVIKPETRSLDFITPAWSAGTRGVVQGKAVLAPANEKELERLNGKLAGAWVLRKRPLAEELKLRRSFIRTLRAAYDRQGIAGFITPSEGNLLITDGSFRISWDNLPDRPSVLLKRDSFDEIVSWLGKGKKVVLEFDIRNHFKQGPIRQFNVIADLKGTEFPEELVIVGGHLDSWDGATGTTDNGTGVATTLEAARLLCQAKIRPRRTIRFLLWSGEEQGLLGSSAYVKAHPKILPRISAVLVHDGGTNLISGLDGTRSMMSDLSQIFAPVMSLDPRYPFALKVVDELEELGSDQDSFLSAGVPGFFWHQAGKADYSHTHHTQFDTFDAALPEDLKHSSLVIALGAYGIAGLDHLLSREQVHAQVASSRRRLGVQLDEMVVTEIEDESAAEKGGVLVGDLILKVDDKAVADRTQLLHALHHGEPRKTIVVEREGKNIDLTIVWEEPSKRK
ncbi:MAG: M28 family metallopeptidase [Isosphaeraceae bacterium]